MSLGFLLSLSRAEGGVDGRVVAGGDKGGGVMYGDCRWQRGVVTKMIIGSGEWWLSR